MSFQQLVSILKEARETFAEDRQRPLVECPICGEPLDFNRGVANCPWGHYRTTRTTSES